MSTKLSPSQKYQILLDALDADTSDDVDTAAAPAFARASVFQKAELRAGQIRRSIVKRDMELSRSVTPRALSDIVSSKSRAIFGLLASRDASFGSKFSVAFRNGKELSDEEIGEILKEAQSLGIDLEELAKNA